MLFIFALFINVSSATETEPINDDPIEVVTDVDTSFLGQTSHDFMVNGNLEFSGDPVMDVHITIGDELSLGCARCPDCGTKGISASGGCWFIHDRTCTNEEM